MRRPVVIPYPYGEQFPQLLQRNDQSQVTVWILQFSQKVVRIGARGAGQAMAKPRRDRSEEALDEGALVRLIGGTYVDGASQQLAGDIEGIRRQMRPGVIKSDLLPAGVGGFG
jgi:hypothetical protein